MKKKKNKIHSFFQSIFRLDGLKVIKGKEIIKKMETSKFFIRNFCQLCGSRIYSYSTKNDMLSIPYGCVKENEKFDISIELEPSSHICYEERIFDIPDKRIKFQGIPKTGKILWYQWLFKSYFHYLIIISLIIFSISLKFGKK